MVPLILGVLVVLLLLGSGLAVAGYFFFLKPWLEANRPGVTVKKEPANENAGTNANSDSGNTNGKTNTNTETKKDDFVPPADAVQFVNSKANLDGQLAEHYVGFSFYYPATFTKDPKAGVAGASSFATITRELSDGSDLQERVLFNWYPSKGSYEADVPVFPDSVKTITEQLSKSLSNLEEVSRGETTVNSYKGYQVRFKGVIERAGKNLPYWCRVIFLPPGSENEKGGVVIVMLATSHSPGVTSAEDVGAKGDLAMILQSFRLTGKP